MVRGPGLEATRPDEEASAVDPNEDRPSLWRGLPSRYKDVEVEAILRLHRRASSRGVAVLGLNASRRELRGVPNRTVLPRFRSRLLEPEVADGWLGERDP